MSPGAGCDTHLPAHRCRRGGGVIFLAGPRFFLLARAFSFDVGRILFFFAGPRYVFRRPALFSSPARAIFFAGPRYVFKRRPALIIFCWPNLFCVGRPSLSLSLSSLLFLLCSALSSLLSCFFAASETQQVQGRPNQYTIRCTVLILPTTAGFSKKKRAH